jgi:hypothetical protein
MKDALLAQYGLDETSAENNTEVNAQLEGIKSMNINADWIERNVEFR